jgi:hypothetical protein
METPAQKINRTNVITMKIDRTTAQKRLPVHTRRPEAYIFLGVQMKILLSSEDTGGQFSLIEGLMPPGGDGGLHLHANEDESMDLLEGELEVTIGEKSSLSLQEKARSEECPAPRIRNFRNPKRQSSLMTQPVEHQSIQIGE